MFRLLGIILLFMSAGLSYGCKSGDDINDPGKQAPTEVRFWLSDPSRNLYFTEQPKITPANASGVSDTIKVNPSVAYQEMDGFGFALTGGSAYHLFYMGAAERKQLLTELFDYNDKNIGTSYLRISIGASDLDAKVFSYCDLPAGETDVNMQKFTLDEDRKFLLPVLKEILAINPNIKILGSPWSAPVWMKTNRSSVGGNLKVEYYNAYALYFVKYIQEMKKEGVNIDAITIQNEPLNPNNNPSMYMSATEQANFIKASLGPAFKNAGIKTKIIVYDHNADVVDYPMSILNDAAARTYVDGSAFHLYGGDIDDLSRLHNAHPDKNLYFTEQWVGSTSKLADNLKWHISELIIGATRNWCKNVIEWNLAADQNQDPHTPGGCTQCLGAVTIQGNTVTRNAAYYIIAHAAKFVRPGSKRIESNIPFDLPNVAFLTPEGRTVVIVLNNGTVKRYFHMNVGGRVILTSLSGGAAGTFIW